MPKMDGARGHVVLLVCTLLLAGVRGSNATTDDSLWTSLIRNCKRPTLSCVQESFYRYVDDGLDSPNDIELGGFVKLSRNSLTFDNTISNTTEDESSAKSDDGPLGDIARTLRNKMVKFVMSHDVQLQLPETYFDGAIFKISPRSLSEDGALINLDILPNNQVWNPNGEGRIFFKKLKEFIGEKLLTALLAILLVIKLLSVKFLFLLPAILGAAAAKKVIIKILLFVFPFLSHVFKFCPYVPHGVKHHHHQHLIKHFHHVPHHPHHHHHDDEGIEVIAPHSSGPPSLHHHLDHKFHDDTPFYKPHEDDLEFYSDGPAYTHEFITHRKDANKKGDEENTVPWGTKPKTTKTPPISNRPLKPSEIENMVAKAEKEALIKARLQQEQLKVQAENVRLQEQIKKALRLQEKLKMQSVLLSSKVPGQIMPPPPPAPNLSPPSQFLRTSVQTKIATTTTTSSPLVIYDPFYSPILEKIDKIMMGLGFNEEPCRERLICSMYKNPPKFSPHSNLLSAELSRDSSELQKPTSTNLAVIRFYKYVQAARDGQDQRDCLRLYPACPVNTEEWK